MNKKVLLFAPYFPPRRRVGSIRPFRFATHLKSLGWQPSIISIRDASAVCTPKELTALDGIEILNIGSPIDNTNAGGSSKKKKSGANALASFIDNRFPIDTWLPLFVKKRREIDQFVSKQNPNLIWSTGDPWSGNYVAGRVARQFQIPWVADFRDPWTLCKVRYTKRKWPATMVDKKAELSIMKSADHITFTAKTTEQKYRDHYPMLKDKTSTIYNSFDKKFYVDKGNEQPLKNDRLNILFLGRFRELSTAASILDVLIELKKQLPSAIERISIYSFEKLINNDYERMIEHGLSHVFKTLAPVPNEQVIALSNHFDLLLLSTHPGRNDIVPAKLHEYLISDRPIFSLAPNPEVGVVLKKTGKGVHFNDEQFSEAATLLKLCIKAKEASSHFPIIMEPNKDEINVFEVSRNTEKLVDIFNTLIAHE